MATKGTKRKPQLKPGMSIRDFQIYYWMKADLIAFARLLGLGTHGYKPELSARILRALRGQPEREKKQSTKAPRDSDKPLHRDTPVLNYRSDKRTRQFFESQIGPSFHFTYHVNQYRLANDGVTYGDLIDEWLAERERRRSKDYTPKIVGHAEYNRFVRAYFADSANKGKTMRHAAAAWNALKPTTDRRYRRR